MTEPVQTTMKIVTFFLDGKLFGVDIDALVEIREWEDPTPLPGVPAWTKGVINLRGQVVPIIDLGDRIGWGVTDLHSRSVVLVINCGGKHTGYLVEDVDNITTINREDIRPAPHNEGPEGDLVSGLVKLEQRATDSKEGSRHMASIIDVNSLAAIKTPEMA
jgi:purine-binding chemotaxis protein CheW